MQIQRINTTSSNFVKPKNKALHRNISTTIPDTIEKSVSKTKNTKLSLFKNPKTFRNLRLISFAAMALFFVRYKKAEKQERTILPENRIERTEQKENSNVISNLKNTSKSEKELMFLGLFTNLFALFSYKKSKLEHDLGLDGHEDWFSD